MWHLHTHILLEKPLRRISLAQLQQVPAVRPPATKVLLPRVPKTAALPDPLVRAPGCRDSCWQCNCWSLSDSVFWCPQSTEAPPLFPTKGLVYFVFPLCHIDTKPEQSGTLHSHGVVSVNRRVKIMNTIRYSKRFHLPRLVKQAWVPSTLFSTNFLPGQRIHRVDKSLCK